MTARRQASPINRAVRRVLVKPRVRTVQALVPTFLRGQYLAAGETLDIVGDEEVSAAVFALLADEAPVFSEVAE